MRVRGLKYAELAPCTEEEFVAPHAGAWIEIGMDIYKWRIERCRTPCGCVD